MGVPGLWEFINDAGQQRSLAHLTIVEGFEKNASSKRAYRIGIDVSIWYNHALYSKEGENPQLRLIFFRLRRLLELPILPLFIFDGRKRPKTKRGSKKGKSGSHPLNRPMQEMLDAFGMEWREAQGEAEAELAYLNEKGFIDAILTDDCDTLVFGACTVIKNWSATLSGNRSDPGAQRSNTSSKRNPQVTLYTAARVKGLGLSRGDLILYALLSGGDYHNGVEGFGPKYSYGLARCSFGERLLKAYQANHSNFQPFLKRWRDEINRELASNSRGFLPRAHGSVPNDFPDLKILEFYVNPTCSRSFGSIGGGAMRDTGELNLGLLAKFCEKYFEWGYRSNVVKRFRDLLWHPAVMHVLRRAALEADSREKAKRVSLGIADLSIHAPLMPTRVEAVGTPASLVKCYLAPEAKLSTEDRYSRVATAFVNRGPQSPQALFERQESIPDPHPLLKEIVGTRQDACTGGLMEYRVEICPTQLVAFTSAGLTGFRASPNTLSNPLKKPPPKADSVMRLWIPATIIRHVHPGLVEEYMMREREKMNKNFKVNGKRRAVTSDEDEQAEEGDKMPTGSPTTNAPVRQAQRPSAVASVTAARAQAALITEYPADKHGNRDEVPLLSPWYSCGNTNRFLFTFKDPDEPDFTKLGTDCDGDLEMSIPSCPTTNPQDLFNTPGVIYNTLCDNDKVKYLANNARQARCSSPSQQTDTIRDDDVLLSDDGDGAPTTAIDALWDSILDGTARKASKGKKPRQSKKDTMGASRTNTAVPGSISTKIRESDSLLTKIDKLDTRQAAKRRKLDDKRWIGDRRSGTNSVQVPLSASSTSRLGDSSSSSGSGFSPHTQEKPTVTSTWRNPMYNYDSSSQDSRLSSVSTDDHHFIDLT